MRTLGIIVILSSLTNLTMSGSYVNYFKVLNKCDSLFYIENKKQAALQEFFTFSSDLEFVWVKDALMYAELSVQEGYPEMAISFLQMAVKNGWDVNLMDYMDLACTCNYFRDKGKMNESFRDFVLQHKGAVQEDYSKIRGSYLKRLDTTLMKKLNIQHVGDEYFKNVTSKKLFYNSMIKSNALYLDSLVNMGYYFGERNCSRLNARVYNQLGIGEYFTDSLALKISSQLNYIRLEDIPYNSARSYYDYTTPVLITLYHGKGFLNHFYQKAYDMVDKGYMRPEQIRWIFQGAKKLGYNISVSRYDEILDLLPSKKLKDAKHKFCHLNGIEVL